MAVYIVMVCDKCGAAMTSENGISREQMHDFAETFLTPQMVVIGDVCLSCAGSVVACASDSPEGYATALAKRHIAALEARKQ